VGQPAPTRQFLPCILWQQDRKWPSREKTVLWRNWRLDRRAPPLPPAPQTRPSPGLTCRVACTWRSPFRFWAVARRFRRGPGSLAGIRAS